MRCCRGVGHFAFEGGYQVREHIELFWSQAWPIPSELSVGEHADLLAKAARAAWRRAAFWVQVAP